MPIQPNGPTVALMERMRSGGVVIASPGRLIEASEFVRVHNYRVDFYDLLNNPSVVGGMVPFDAYIQVGPAQLLKARLSPDLSKTVVRYAVLNAIRHAPGAGWVDVAVTDHPSGIRPWVTVCPTGRPVMPDMPQWQRLRAEVEALIEATLVGLQADGDAEPPPG
jgi:hypothetical protein